MYLHNQIEQNGFPFDKIQAKVMNIISHFAQIVHPGETKSKITQSRLSLRFGGNLPMPKQICSNDDDFPKKLIIDPGFL